MQRLGIDPWVGKIPGGGQGNPLQYSCLENPVDRGTWQAAVYAVAQSQTQLTPLNRPGGAQHYLPYFQKKKKKNESREMAPFLKV